MTKIMEEDNATRGTEAGADVQVASAVAQADGVTPVQPSTSKPAGTRNSGPSIVPCLSSPENAPQVREEGVPQSTTLFADILFSARSHATNASTHTLMHTCPALRQFLDTASDCCGSLSFFLIIYIAASRRRTQEDPHRAHQRRAQPPGHLYQAQERPHEESHGAECVV